MFAKLDVEKFEMTKFILKHHKNKEIRIAAVDAIAAVELDEEGFWHFLLELNTKYGVSIDDAYAACSIVKTTKDSLSI